MREEGKSNVRRASSYEGKLNTEVGPLIARQHSVDPNSTASSPIYKVQDSAAWSGIPVKSEEGIMRHLPITN
jgi:hypothetical protein